MRLWVRSGSKGALADVHGGSGALLEFHGGERSSTDAFDAFIRQAERSHAQTAGIDLATSAEVSALSGAQLESERDRLYRIIRQAPGRRLQRDLAAAEAELTEFHATAEAATNRRSELEQARPSGRRRELSRRRTRNRTAAGPRTPPPPGQLTIGLGR
jgi:hypothetical protein